ncbi:unnamed protein product [Adineta ricciae]|uniref:Uncharacterized protein n=1 Tax=Adineta ricciae TaxID=249248 RepID=A0A813W9H2_ADIRI|nr:unnamed protein product [Adineta ricciae]CAF1194255.1 unnamed protein product [Adineta ricciae]
MTLDPFFRRMTMIAGVFAFMGVVLGVVSLATNYWTMEYEFQPGMPMMMNHQNTTMRWNGLFYRCMSGENQCVTMFWRTTFILCLLGMIFMFVGGIFSVWEMFQTSDRRFFIPMLYFVAVVMMTAGLFDYGSYQRMNYHSSRCMVAAVVFGYAALPMSAFIAGRYSAYDRYVNNGHVSNGQKYVPAATNGN